MAGHKCLLLTTRHQMQARHVAAGTIARTLAQLTIHPLDTVKTRLQVHLRLLGTQSAGCGTASHESPVDLSASAFNICRSQCLLPQQQACRTNPSLLLQINKSTAPEQLRMWRHTSKCHPVDFYVGRQRVIHLRNVLIQVCAWHAITPAPTVMKLGY